jgi:hypothetical protein
MEVLYSAFRSPDFQSDCTFKVQHSTETTNSLNPFQTFVTKIVFASNKSTFKPVSEQQQIDSNREINNFLMF